MRSQVRRGLRRARAGAAALVLIFAPIAGLGQHGDGIAPAQELLNSERIEASFGSYGVDVLSSDASLRVSSLYSLDASGKTTRTFAVVLYPEDVAPELGAAHAAILAGGSIGSTLRAEGWNVIKTHRYFGEIPSTARLGRLMRIGGTVALALHVYVLEAARTDARLEYATLAEIHHPDHLTPAAVVDIYAPDWQSPAAADPLVAEMLEVVAEETR